MAGPSGPTVSVACLQDYARDRLEAARDFPKTRLLRHVFRLPRLDMTVWFANERFAQLCKARLFERQNSEPAKARAEIHALDAELKGWAPPAKWDEGAGFSSWEFDQILAAGGLRGFYHHDAPSWQIYEPHADVGVQCLPSALGIPPWELASPLRLFLHWAYAAAGLRLTHSATLGSEGRGVLIVGPSGSGKSATTLAGLLNGLDSAGDDYVLVEDDGTAVTAHSLFKTLKQDSDWLLRAGAAPEALGPAQINWRGKIELDAAEITGRPLADRMEIDALLIPEVARATHTSFEKVAAQSAALALAPSAVFQLPGDAAEGYRFFARLAKRLPAYRVRLSQDPAEIAAAIASFLARSLACRLA